MIKNICWLAGLFALPVLIGCSARVKEEEPAQKLLVTGAFRADTSVQKNYVCQVQSHQHIEVRAMERGYLQDIFVDEGQHVTKGQLMFRIMPLLYKAEMQKAQAEVNFVEIEYQNTKALADKNIVSANELALAKAKLEKAKAELSLAEVHYSFTEIRAPFDGIMDRLEVRRGSLVDEGELLTNLSDNSKMWVYFNVPEAEYLDYKTSDHNDKEQVSLLMANHEVFGYAGVVETIEADFDNETGNIPFRATFPNPKGLLRHGETGNILITVPFKNAVIIPQKATYEILDKKYVYVVDKEDRVQAREITIGAELPDLYIVSAGVSGNEKILVEGIRKVKNNDRISYNFQEPKTVLQGLRLHAE